MMMGIVALLLSGCASFNPSPVVEKIHVEAGLSEYEKQALATTVSSAIEDIREEIRQGNCTSSQRQVNYLLSHYGSEEGALESALLTSLCLCYIEKGEIERFFSNASHLKKMSSQLNIMDRETQFVLTLASYLNKREYKTDSSINMAIQRGFDEIFGEGKINDTQ